MLIDAILFTDELDMLELRLNELDSVVDKFVIVEALEAHGSVKRREPCFAYHRDHPALKKFAHKIVYEVLTELRPPYTDGTSGWARENYHRECLMLPVLQIAGPDDIVIVSDADEIPRAKTIQRYLGLRDQIPGLCFLRLDHYFYNVNCYDAVWMRSSIGPLRAYQDMGGFQPPRGHLGDVIGREVTALNNAGWHFSSFFPVERLREKLQNFAHAYEVRPLLEFSDDQLKTIIRARKNIFTGKDLAHRPTLNPTLPQYFLDNLERFSAFTEEGLCST
jgi:beta-1,4-mannosyl-glycoprotein beta-1,4-N-acetylglucosaminyltransferase